MAQRKARQAAAAAEKEDEEDDYVSPLVFPDFPGTEAGLADMVAWVKRHGAFVKRFNPTDWTTYQKARAAKKQRVYWMTHRKDQGFMVTHRAQSAARQPAAGTPKGEVVRARNTALQRKKAGTYLAVLIYKFIISNLSISAECNILN